MDDRRTGIRSLQRSENQAAAIGDSRFRHRFDAYGLRHITAVRRSWRRESWPSRLHRLCSRIDASRLRSEITGHNGAMAIDVSPFRVREGRKVDLKRWPTR